MSLRTIASFLYRYSSPGKIFTALRYPGIRIAGGGRLDIRGAFSYGEGCMLGVGTNLVVRPAKGLHLGGNCSIGRYVEFGPDPQIRIGSDTSIQDRSIILGDVTMGRYCSLAPNVYISSGRHWFDLHPHALIKDQDRQVLQNETLSMNHNRPVTVEDDCWLGINAVVMPGVTIGKGAVVGANSVVTRDVEPYSVVAGAPAKLLKRRLEFVPPPRISFDRPHDHPYFYAGFDVSEKSAEAGVRAGGLAAHGEFVIALDAASGKTLHIMSRAANGGAATLVFGDQRAEISGVYAEEVFSLHGCAGNRMRFSARTADGPADVFVKKAWIQ